MESALRTLGGRQRDLLQLLLRHKEGCTADEIAAELDVTRTAVRQHLAALERDGFVQRGQPRKTMGRPGFVYELSAQGRELFPRQYSWFSSLLLDSLKQQHGSEGLADYLRGMAANLAAAATRDLADAPVSARLTALARTMNELGYDAQVVRNGKDDAEVQAFNCVYHHLAENYPQLCAFDVELIGRVADRKVEHTECMVRGGRSCRFRLTPRS